MSALTKIFIVLQLVCSLVIAVVLVVALKTQNPLQKDVGRLNADYLAAQAALATKNSELALKQVENERTATELRNVKGDSDRKYSDLLRQFGDKETELASLKATMLGKDTQVQQLASANDSLSKENARLHGEIERMAPENAGLIQKNAELSRANSELVVQVDYAGKTIRKLQEALEAAKTKGGAGAATNGDSGTVAQLSQQAAAQVNGKVTNANVSAGRNLLEIGLGARDGLKVGQHVVVSRNGAFIADAVVEKVTPDASVAVTTDNIKRGETVKSGDLVTAGNPQ